MFILEELWQGNITPNVRQMQNGGAYQKAMCKITELSDAFSKELSEDGKRAIKEYEDLQMELFDISDTDAFIRGVRIGVKLMLDVFLPYDSPLPQVAGENS